MLDLSNREASLDRSPPPGGLAADLRRDGFAFVAAPVTRRLVEAAGGRDWESFAASWDDLGPDRFMADGGTYRRRRFGCFAVAGDAVHLKPPQPHFQTVEDNPLNGGIARTFEPVLAPIALHPINRALLAIGRSLFAAALSRVAWVAPRNSASLSLEGEQDGVGEPTPSCLAAGARAPVWHVEMHQFRIAARPDAVGQPTPEGLHRDGVDGVMMMMVRRENLEGGESTIADADRRPIHRATLARPFDAAVVDDRRVFHGVSAVRPLDPARAAFRDVLVLTFRAEEA